MPAGPLWLPNPPPRTRISIGFDGSEENDWTALRCETIDGLQFTPRYGPDARPTIWNPEEWNGSIPRGEVNVAVDEVFSRYRVARMYCDPKDWQSEIGDWSVKYGAEHVFEWRTEQIKKMWEALEQFRTDLVNGRITHDGCPVAEIHIRNAIKAARPGQQYILNKASETQKNVVAMASVLAHRAAMDSQASGWRNQGDSDGFIYTGSSTRR